MKLTQRKAKEADIPAIVSLYLQDTLGKTREKSGTKIDQRYTDAFHHINTDQNQNFCSF